MYKTSLNVADWEPANDTEAWPSWEDEIATSPLQPGEADALPEWIEEPPTDEIPATDYMPTGVPWASRR